MAPNILFDDEMFVRSASVPRAGSEIFVPQAESDRQF